MEKDTTKAKKPYSINNKDDKFFFCHFANMARHNAFMILAYVTEQLALPTKIKEDSLKEAAVLNVDHLKNPELFAHLMALLQKHFPFFSYLRDNGDPKIAIGKLTI